MRARFPRRAIRAAPASGLPPCALASPARVRVPPGRGIASFLRSSAMSPPPLLLDDLCCEDVLPELCWRAVLEDRLDDVELADLGDLELLAAVRRLGLEDEGPGGVGPP